MVLSARPLLLGHRGCGVRRDVPENSFTAFELAFQHGCDGFEFDVRLTASGRAVVCHNARVRGIRVSEARPTQLRSLPQLDQVLERYSRRGFLDIELKVKGLEAKVLAALRAYPPERDCVVSSFRPDVILELKARSPVVPVGIICETPGQLVAWRRLPVEHVIVHKSLVNRRLVQLVHKAGRKIFAWTVNDRLSMLRLAQWGVDAIISDRTDLLVQTLGSAARPKPPSAQELRAPLSA